MHIKTAAFIIICACLLTPFARADLENGSFEKGAAGWRQYWFRGSAGASIKPDDKLRRYGVKSLSIKIPAENSRFRLSQTREIEPNTTYRVVFWFYTHATGGKGGSFRIGPSDKAGRHLGHFGHRTLHPTGNIWTEQEVFFKSPPTADKAMFEFNFHGPLEGWLDHVSCQRIDEAARKDLKLLYDHGPAVYEELIVPDRRPNSPRMFPRQAPSHGSQWTRCNRIRPRTRS